MALCTCFFQGSRSWIVLAFTILAVFASLTPVSGFQCITMITVSAVLIFLGSTLFGSKLLSTKKVISVDNSELEETSTDENELPFQDKVTVKTLTSSKDDSTDKFDETLHEEAYDELYVHNKEFVIPSHSESESTGNYSYSTENEDDNCSDIEWPYNIEQRIINCSDGSISDEESLIEIAIPSGQFVCSPEKDDPKCCKLSTDYFSQESTFLKNMDMDLSDDCEINEEDNLIEIDIYMGSIKCSTFGM